MRFFGQKRLRLAGGAVNSGWMLPAGLKAANLGNSGHDSGLASALRLRPRAW